jgi:hypothetical protein
VRIRRDDTVETTQGSNFAHILSMMFSMRVRLLTAAWALAASIAIFGVGAATAAAPPATNGGATNIGSTRATLNGTVDITDTAPQDSFWYFEYGTTTKYGKSSPAIITGPEDTAVSVSLTGLTPDTTYHFRLVVAQNANYSPAYSPSADGMFTTLTNGGSGGSGGSSGKSGRSSLTSHRLKVQGGYVSLSFKCSGATGSKCKGAVIIAATGKLGNAKKKTMYGCAGGSFSMTAGRTTTLRMKVSRSCKTLLKQAHNHQLKATLRATYSTHQSSLKTGVTLLG